MADIAEAMAGMLSYLNDEGMPKVTGIRNFKRIPSVKHFRGYTYLFEAEVNGEWVEYGPCVCGNFTVRRDCPDHTLPETNELFMETSTKTIYLGLYDLDKFFEKVGGEDLLKDIGVKG